MFRRTQLRIKKLYNISMTIEFQEFYQKKNWVSRDEVYYNE